MYFNESPSVAILGGGTAGWLTALFLKIKWPDLSISVIEDPNKPPIIAGESGSYALLLMLDELQIDIIDWVKNTKATPKIGGTFYDWNGKDSVFKHALVTKYYHAWERDFPSIDERYYYLRGLIGDNIPLVDIFPVGSLVDQNKVPFDRQGNPIDNINPMWHFDSRANAAYLKNIGISRGISLVEGSYQHCNKDINGNIKTLYLDNTSIQADWFFDCSGFAKLLLEKEYNIDHYDYSKYFPASAVVAWWDKPCFNVTTIATAMDAGWSWKIGLTERTGQGYLYDPDLLTADQALDEARLKFGDHIEPVAQLKFKPSILKEFQKNNVIGIGLSTGFLEPLEANGVSMIIHGIQELSIHWNPNFPPNSESIKKYNDSVFEAYDHIKDFLCLHYRGKGLNTDFWLDQRTNKERIPDSLSIRLEEWSKFYDTGNMNYIQYQKYYSIESWLTVIQGLNIIDHKKIKIGDAKKLVKKYYETELKLNKLLREKSIGIHTWNKLLKKL